MGDKLTYNGINAQKEFIQDVSVIINRYSIDARLHIPDYILAEHVALALENLHRTLWDTDVYKNS